MPDAPLALVVEDDAAVRRFLRTGMEAHGWRVIEADNGAEAASLAVQYVPDLVLLDLGLPDMDGTDVIGRLRAWSAVPILVVSARGQERQKVAALDAGADDYLTKPFGFPELLARIRATQRRAVRTEHPDAVVVAGGLRVDLEARVVTLGGREVHLTPIEFRLLAVLARHAGKVVTHRQLVEAVWGPRSREGTQTLRVHMTHLRRKLDVGGTSPFATEAGIGYRLVLPDGG
jgi:two-component system KDP operon response regulator KdpE